MWSKCKAVLIEIVMLKSFWALLFSEGLISCKKDVCLHNLL